MPIQGQLPSLLSAETLDQAIGFPLALLIHALILPTQLAVSSLEEVFFYAYIPAKLEMAGISRERLEQAVAIGGKISVLAPVSMLASKMETFWCLRRKLPLRGAGEKLGPSALRIAKLTLQAC